MKTALKNNWVYCGLLWYIWRADAKLLASVTVSEKQDAKLSALVPWQYNSIQSRRSPVQSSQRWRLPYPGQWVNTGRICPLRFVSKHCLFLTTAHIDSWLFNRTAAGWPLSLDLIQDSIVICNIFTGNNLTSNLWQKWYNVTAICLVLLLYVISNFCTHTLHCEASSLLFAYSTATEQHTWPAVTQIILHGYFEKSTKQTEATEYSNQYLTLQLHSCHIDNRFFVFYFNNRYQNCVYTYRILPNEDKKLSVQVG